MPHIPPLLHLLDTVLGRVPDLTIRRGIPLTGLAEIEFDTRTITLKPGLKLGQLHVGFVHELLHLLRGPAQRGLEDDEEDLVHSAVAQLLAPRHCLPAILDGADPTQIAERLGIDRYTARLALELARADDTTTGAA